MLLELRAVDPKVDFPPLIQCQVDAYRDPPQKYTYIMLPVPQGEGEASRVAIQEAAKRFQLWDTDDRSHWMKVIEVKTGRIVGGSSWRIYHTNPYNDTNDLEVTWFPDDSSRKFADMALTCQAMPKYRAAQKAHIHLLNIFTHPHYRRQGVAQQNLQWGIDKADELGLEIFLEATPSGKLFYEANGFIVIEEFIVAPTTENRDDKWKEMEEKTSVPVTFWLMHRPLGGKHDKQKQVRPWDL
ncbi:unnamed protein product [Clonostachys chloroleuca]|uniref:N-acetyltransferase domain-containing protein n=1 Tax=Clonostachys chloroleuca TaxID=1926264 RepID=A0AA35MB57_9HYPO|nr:unnamed protein product [Clonostachys chloroleuca]